MFTSLVLVKHFLVALNVNYCLNTYIYHFQGLEAKVSALSIVIGSVHGGMPEADSFWHLTVCVSLAGSDSEDF